MFFKSIEGRLKFAKPTKIHSYAAIVGPSSMGKTQLAFILAVDRPVFYINFADGCGLQEIYKVFHRLSDHIREVLKSDAEALIKLKAEKDVTTMKKKEPETDADYDSYFESKFLSENKNFRLKIIGFIWKMVEYSTEFDFESSNGEWFNHYLKKRTMNFMTKWVR